MTRLFSFALTALTLLAWTPAFADSHCKCSQKCAHECHNGKSNHSSCKGCGKSCSEGKGESCKQEKNDQVKESSK